MCPMETSKGDIYSAARVQSTTAINCSCSLVQEHLADIPARSSVAQGKRPELEQPATNMWCDLPKMC